MTHYVDSFLAAVPTANKDAYISHVKVVADIFMKHGALSYSENWGDEVPAGELTSMAKAVMATDDETVVIGWVVWESKAKRDAVRKTLMDELHSMLSDHPMPFDGKWLIFGGFENLIDS